MKIKKQIIFLIILLGVYGLLLAQPITLLTSDLGRHLKNGEIILNGSWEEKVTLLTTNFYSYTNTYFPFINHHWLTGVVFYLIKGLLGFTGLQIVNILISILTLYIFFDIARRFSNLYIACLATILVLPVISNRTEIRPEVFTNLFSAIFFWILINFNFGKISNKYLFLLPIIELFWVNLHIYFFLGYLIMGVFIFERLIKKKSVKILFIILGLTILAGLVNPSGIKGFLHPFKIYTNYGYSVLEEQTLFKIESIGYFPVATYFKILFIALLGSWIIYIWQKKINISLSNLFLSILFTSLGVLMVRNFTLFGYFALSILAFNLGSIKYPKFIIKNVKFLIFLVLPFLIIFVAIRVEYWQHRTSIGLGLILKDDSAARFFLDNDIRGPVFNNYDLGGYFIYHLFPKEKVFMDNRPETYPASFFKEVYVPMQEGSKWQEMDRKYNFQSIFFYTQGLTAWRIQFIRLRSLDPNWAIVYLDESVIIFAKRNGINQKVIDNYQIPAESLVTVQ